MAGATLAWVSTYRLEIGVGWFGGGADFANCMQNWLASGTLADTAPCPTDLVSVPGSLGPTPKPALSINASSSIAKTSAPKVKQSFMIGENVVTCVVPGEIRLLTSKVRLSHKGPL